uniref:Secreted protein n=1 Tax=Neogobius melanostomus TaxID=47308 RepID=A0A8C6SZ02_9GOBI
LKLWSIMTLLVTPPLCCSCGGSWCLFSISEEMCGSQMVLAVKLASCLPLKSCFLQDHFGLSTHNPGVSNPFYLASYFYTS